MNGTFLRTEVYIFFTLTLIVCYQKLRYITKSTNATVIGICESKLDTSVLDAEISIDNYKILRCDRNKQGGGVAYYVRNDLSYNTLSVFPVKLKTFSLKFYYLTQNQ